MSEPRIYTVSELQREVRLHLEQEYRGLWVQGEVSDLTVAASGHHYLNLKDEKSVLRAVIWKSAARRLEFDLEEGQQVRARGHLTVYEPRGSYQMIVDRLEPVGAGPLQIKFEQMCRRLEDEGLFSDEHKKPLPEFPTRVALITSPTGAAVRDLIDVALRRWPPLELVVVPVKVQGDGAAEEIAAGIALADGHGFDILVVGRGGGSLEDLWAFNEEIVARAIYRARTPVVSAVGHEVDVSISDLVADVRAPTPSAAAEILTPSREEVRAQLDMGRQRMKRSLLAQLQTLGARLATVEASAAFKMPWEMIRREEQRLDDCAHAIAERMRNGLLRRRTGLERLAASLEALSPLKVLARGYSVTRTAAGRLVTRPPQVASGEEIRTTLEGGEIRSRVV